MFGIIAIFIALGHSVLAMSGEESLAQVYREIESPKLPNLKKAGAVILSTVSFYFLGLLLCRDDHSGRRSPALLGKPHRRAGHES